MHSKIDWSAIDRSVWERRQIGSQIRGALGLPVRMPEIRFGGFQVLSKYNCASSGKQVLLPGIQPTTEVLMDVQALIKEQVSTHPVVLYMKGTPQAPMCGFSATAVQILRACNLPLFFSVNVLEEPEIREGVKVFSNWPTLPQLYIRGEFVGGCDIMREMYQSGELQKMLEGIAAPE